MPWPLECRTGGKEAPMSKRRRRGGHETSGTSAFKLALGLGLGITLVSIGPGCDRVAVDAGPGTAPASDAAGFLSVGLAGLAATSTTGFQIDVTTVTGAPGTSRFVSTAPAANTLFILPPGVYLVTATAMDAAGIPTAGCLPASGPATVTKGVSASVVLVSRCTSGDQGGLDVTVRTDHAPTVASVAYDPATTVTPCEPLAVTIR